MEKVTGLSHLKVVRNTQAIDIPDTGLGFREHHRVQVMPNTPCNPEERKFNFQVQPVIPSGNGKGAVYSFFISFMID